VEQIKLHHAVHCCRHHKRNCCDVESDLLICCLWCVTSELTMTKRSNDYNIAMIMIRCQKLIAAKIWYRWCCCSWVESWLFWSVNRIAIISLCLPKNRMNFDQIRYDCNWKFIYHAFVQIVLQMKYHASDGSDAASVS
jgi:hypothetical protein